MTPHLGIRKILIVGDLMNFLLCSKRQIFQQVRVYAPENDYERIDYPLEVGAKVISFYEKVFDEPYPLPKLGERCFNAIFTNLKIPVASKNIAPRLY